MNRGYVRLWRKSLDNDLIRNPLAWQFMSWCLLKATHKPRKQIVGTSIVELQPGQLVFGRASAAREINSTERKIRTCLELLKNIDFLTIKATNRFSIISIVNWNSYQDSCPAGGQHDDQEATSKRPANDHKQEYKNINTGGGGECARARVADSVPENQPDLAEDSLEPVAPADGGREGPKKTDCPSKGTPEWPAFLSCWQVHPVKQGKEEAWREWMRLKANGTLAQAWEIRDAILRLSAEDSRWLRGKVPKMAKWLNGKGWDDEPFVEPETAALPAVRDRPRSGFSPPVARTQHQKGRQDMEGVAKLVLAAEKELEHGDHTAHYGGTRQDGNALPAANERGRTAGIGRSMDGDLP